MEIKPPLLTFVRAMFTPSTDKFTTETARFWFCIVFARLVVVDRIIYTWFDRDLLFRMNENVSLNRRQQLSILIREYKFHPHSLGVGP